MELSHITISLTYFRSPSVLLYQDDGGQYCHCRWCFRINSYLDQDIVMSSCWFGFVVYLNMNITRVIVYLSPTLQVRNGNPAINMKSRREKDYREEICIQIVLAVATIFLSFADYWNFMTILLITLRTSIN